MPTLALLLLTLNPVETVLVERVDAIECNTCFDEKGCVIFDQLLFRNFNPHTGQFEIAAWRIVRDHAWMTPRTEGGEYVVTWIDSSAIRSVRAKSRQVSGYQFDQENIEREWTPTIRRQGLAPTYQERRSRARLQ